MGAEGLGRQEGSRRDAEKRDVNDVYKIVLAKNYSVEKK